MRIRWRGFELPSKVLADTATMTETYGRFAVEPFEKGFGHTVGNGLRRVLLSSIEGGAVTSVKIANVQHEFSSVTGVLEDVTDIVLNVKQLLVRVEGDEPAALSIDVTKKGPVTGADIVCDQRAEVVNKDLVIATLTEKVNFKVSMMAQRGRGYRTAEENAADEREIGVIPVDSNFSPVKRVRYKVEDTRVGKMTNYDKLVIEVWTDGTVRPDFALIEAAKIYRKHLNPFIHHFHPGADLAVEEARVMADEAAEKEQERLREMLSKPIEELDLSVRARNCLDAESVATVGDLVRKTEADLLKIKNFGKTSLKEIKKKLADLNLALGMDTGDVSSGKA
ncbi:MAG: DNA-directed RNA polymerase subunit alpha [Planctomycetes bacterium]|nr:DNA-directed RNA polymerase subunit alpha [Planctomycetota bacterium]MCC7170101.1 DNA-directed RNA polymerase subunit alpha [Planctomycetota bacterium]